MRSFTDNAGRAWTIALSFGSAKRVRALLEVNLLELEAGDPPLLTRLGTDVMLLCDVIFALIKPQADEQSVTDEEWAEAMGGDAMLQAQKALYEELIDFFLKRGREDMRTAIATQQKMIELAIQAGAKRLADVDPEAEIGRIFGGSDTSSPAASE